MFGFNVIYLLMIFLGAVFAVALYFVNGFVLFKDSLNNKVKAVGVFALSVVFAVPSAFALNYSLHPVAWGDSFFNLSGLAFHTLYTSGFMFLYSGLILNILKLNAVGYLNAAVPSIAIFTGISKIGCAVVGCCGGIAINNFVVPTAVIECAIGFLMLLAFQFFIKTNRFSKYLIAYGAFRFLIEFLRADTNSVLILGILTPEQLFAIIMLTVGLVILFRKRSKRYETI